MCGQVLYDINEVSIAFLSSSANRFIVLLGNTSVAKFKIKGLMTVAFFNSIYSLSR